MVRPVMEARRSSADGAILFCLHCRVQEKSDACWHASFQYGRGSPIHVCSIRKGMVKGSASWRDIVVVGGSAGSLEDILIESQDVA